MRWSLCFWLRLGLEWFAMCRRFWMSPLVFNWDALWKVLEVVLYCVEPLSEERPSMSEVVVGLLHALELEENPSLRNPIDLVTLLKNKLEDEELRKLEEGRRQLEIIRKWSIFLELFSGDDDLDDFDEPVFIDSKTEIQEVANPGVLGEGGVVT